MSLKSKDAKAVKEYDIETYTKGFVAESTIDGIVTKEYFQFREIQQIIHYPETGIEVVFFNGRRRVFYNDALGESQLLYNAVNNTMISWMNSNLN